MTQFKSFFSLFAPAAAAVAIATSAIGAPADADRRSRGGYDSSGPNPWAHVCTAEERGRIDMASRAWCIANDGELECASGGTWQCCDDIGHCSDGGTLAPTRAERVRGYGAQVIDGDRFTYVTRFERARRDRDVNIRRRGVRANGISMEDEDDSPTSVHQRVSTDIRVRDERRSPRHRRGEGYSLEEEEELPRARVRDRRRPRN